ncbi:tyrosine-type recombinase/integrase [Chitinophaga sp. CF418]|uniref:tyrosine-type recombinase/integrase n=1 Tax=Chitinophaga sp. CF418 TaxID=1855287 RepID=UPI00091F85AD|nr:tyrosine-type recombinase/integrase [Chitinophaga sp. CF418]SHN42184.1 Phage integrase family protein [Chitinophaga sp. CF418]
MTSPNQKTPYTTPVLCGQSEGVNSEWYVYCEYTHAGKKYPRKWREGINRIKDLKQKTIEAEALLEARKEWLKAGWNPITDPKFKLRHSPKTSANKENVVSLSISAALKWALDKKKLSNKSRLGYASQINHIETAITNLFYDGITITQLTRFHVKTILQQVETDRSLSDHGYNKYKDVISSMLGELEQWEIIEYNPASKIPSREVPESEKYKALTAEEKQKIAEHLCLEHPLYFVYLLVIYHTGIRPKEVLALRISCINFQSRIITIEPNPEEENAKTRKRREVPIPDELFEYLASLELSNYPMEYYVFGSPYTGQGGYRGRRKEGKGGAMHPNYFLSSPNQIKRDTVTKLWQAIVKKQLGIDKFMYGMKHTGGDDKILAGVDLDALRNLYGHGSKRMTETYTKKIKGVYKNEIIKKAPEFINKLS